MARPLGRSTRLISTNARDKSRWCMIPRPRIRSNDSVRKIECLGIHPVELGRNAPRCSGRLGFANSNIRDIDSSYGLAFRSEVECLKGNTAPIFQYIGTNSRRTDEAIECNTAMFDGSIIFSLRQTSFRRKGVVMEVALALIPAPLDIRMLLRGDHRMFRSYEQPMLPSPYRICNGNRPLAILRFQGISLVGKAAFRGRWGGGTPYQSETPGLGTGLLA